MKSKKLAFLCMHFFRKYALLVVVLFMIGIFFTGCGSEKDQDGDGVIDVKDKCPDTAIGVAVDEDGCPIVESKLNRIKLYVENSASNQGYFSGNTDFKSMVGDLVRIAETGISDSASMGIYFISKEVKKFEGSGFDFIQSMSTGNVAGGEGFPLDQMFREIKDDFKSGDVIFFVSDCILSHTDEQIRQNKEINKEGLNALRTGIAYVFQELSKKGLYSSIYAFRSDFNGDYYNYRNEGKGKKVSEVRPYYLWVIAEPENMKKIQALLSENESFRPERESHFGPSAEPISKFTFYPGLESKGEWMPDISKTRIYDIKSNKKDPGIHFAIGLDLKALPPHAQTKEYLKNNLKVTSDEFDVEYELIDKSAEHGQLLRGDVAKEYRTNTHTILIKLDDSSIKQGKISVQLPLVYDEWYQQWSCDSDLTKEEREGRTFALTYLIDGVKSAYSSNKNQNLISLIINIEK